MSLFKTYLESSQNIINLENLAIKCNEQAKYGLTKSIFIGNINLSKYYIFYVLEFFLLKFGITEKQIKEIINLHIAKNPIESLISKLESYELKFKFNSLNYAKSEEEFKNNTFSYLKNDLKNGISHNEARIKAFFNKSAKKLKFTIPQITEASKTFF